MFICEEHGGKIAAIACGTVQRAVQDRVRISARVVIDEYNEPILLCATCADEVLAGRLPSTEFERPLGPEDSLGALCPACVDDWLAATDHPCFEALAADAEKVVLEDVRAIDGSSSPGQPDGER